VTNYEIADYFALLSKLMDLHGENAFKSKTYSIAAYHIEQLKTPIAEMEDAELFMQRGIGDSIGKKIREIENTGKLQALDEILEKTPTGVLEIMEIKGLGPKKVAVIWKEMGIESVGELEYACHENRLVEVKGFGAKTQQSVLENIAFRKQNQGFHLWAEVEHVANNLVKQLQQIFPQHLFAITGEFRRQCDVLEAIDVVTDLAPEQLKKQFENVPNIAFEDSNEGLNIRLPYNPLYRFLSTSKENFYQTLFLTSGSEAFIAAFKEQYMIPDTIANEADIFTVNNLSFIPPAQRELPSILKKASSGNLPALIQPTDIKGIIHSHSTWSDGSDTLEVMARTAWQQGFEYLVISDHSQAAYYAQGLSPEKIAAQHQEIDGLNKKLAPFKIFKSIEADILNDGSLDYNADVLNTFDLVIASVHSNLKMTEEKAMARVMAAIENPFTTILGHPTGRLLLSRPGYPLDHKTIINACACHGVVIEINAHPKRLDLDWRWIEYALEQGVLLSINPDAHAIAGFKDVYFGVKAAQKGGLTAMQNLSSFGLKEMEVFLERKKKAL
jgi:DNA polymerase (family 10)